MFITPCFQGFEEFLTALKRIMSEKPVAFTFRKLNVMFRQGRAVIAIKKSRAFQSFRKEIALSRYNE